MEVAGGCWDLVVRCLARKDEKVDFVSVDGSAGKEAFGCYKGEVRSGDSSRYDAAGVDSGHLGDRAQLLLVKCAKKLGIGQSVRCQAVMHVLDGYSHFDGRSTPSFRA